jgi:hypothetical protein
MQKSVKIKLLLIYHRALYLDGASTQWYRVDKVKTKTTNAHLRSEVRDIYSFCTYLFQNLRKSENL